MNSPEYKQETERLKELLKQAEEGKRTDFDKMHVAFDYAAEPQHLNREQRRHTAAPLCPKCKRKLERGREGWHCEKCNIEFDSGRI